jgi:uncharacterized surface protein with fasciclin (FAS1) repeats
MNRSTLRRSTGIAAAALTLSMGLAACGSESDTGAESESSPSETPSETSEAPEETEAAGGAAAGTFGPGCSQVPADGAGSFDGMATEPVATAASANPLLETLVTAVGEADLVDTLNSAEEITVFAPANDAFAAIPKKDLNALLADKQALTQVLTYHVVPEQLSPEEVAGEFETLAGPQLEITGEGENLAVGDGDAAVLCGGIQTRNATVYVIDSVLMPPM